MQVTMVHGGSPTAEKCRWLVRIVYLPWYRSTQ